MGGGFICVISRWTNKTEKRVCVLYKHIHARKTYCPQSVLSHRFWFQSFARRFGDEYWQSHSLDGSVWPVSCAAGRVQRHRGTQSESRNLSSHTDGHGQRAGQTRRESISRQIELNTRTHIRGFSRKTKCCGYNKCNWKSQSACDLMHSKGVLYIYCTIRIILLSFVYVSTICVMVWRYK